MSTLKPSTSLRRIESGTTDSALSTSRPSLAGSRRRSASLPSPVLDRPRPGEIVDAQNTVDTILDIGAYNQLSDSSALLVTPLVTPRDAPIEPPRISSKEVTFDTSGASYYTLEVVVEETETPNKRNSMDRTSRREPLSARTDPSLACSARRILSCHSRMSLVPIP